MLSPYVFSPFRCEIHLILFQTIVLKLCCLNFFFKSEFLNFGSTLKIRRGPDPEKSDFHEIRIPEKSRYPNSGEVEKSEFQRSREIQISRDPNPEMTESLSNWASNYLLILRAAVDRGVVAQSAVSVHIVRYRDADLRRSRCRLQTYRHRPERKVAATFALGRAAGSRRPAVQIVENRCKPRKGVAAMRPTVSHRCEQQGVEPPLQPHLKFEPQPLVQSELCSPRNFRRRVEVRRRRRVSPLGLEPQQQAVNLATAGAVIQKSAAVTQIGAPLHRELFPSIQSRHHPDCVPPPPSSKGFSFEGKGGVMSVYKDSKVVLKGGEGEAWHNHSASEESVWRIEVKVEICCNALNLTRYSSGSREVRIRRSPTSVKSEFWRSLEIRILEKLRNPNSGEVEKSESQEIQILR
ncbi:unnamed protein product [Cuscuta campestris]|uniref:Uncharacterized protein n=1 Tax=Cuscuta campestris TaxID=132261 RepID=A0A484LCI8_9ASTE|nr:unnamed protein product [Cuscuta campestris]